MAPTLNLLLIVIVSMVAATVGEKTKDPPVAAEEARLLVSKQLMNKFLVESMDVVISYNFFNTGPVSASNVELKDMSFGPDFQVVGQTEINLGRIAPNANVTHTLVIKPLKYGYYNFTAAQVTYVASDETKEVIQGWTSEPGEGYIAPFREFDKRFSPHLLDWAAFAIMSVPPLLIPFMLWHSSKSKFESVLSVKKTK